VSDPTTAAERLVLRWQPVPPNARKHFRFELDEALAEAAAPYRAALERLVAFCDIEVPYWGDMPYQDERWAIYNGLLKEARALLRREVGS
jgi:hypothetical protein